MPKRRSPGEGSVIPYKGARGTTWRAKFVDENGKQRMVTLRGVENQTQAKEALSELMVEVRAKRKRGERRPSEIPTFGSYRETWVEQQTVERAWAERSRKAMDGSLKRLSTFFDPMPLNVIRRKHGREYVQAQGGRYGNRTVGYDLRTLADVLNGAVDDELLELNPLLGMPHPKVVDREWRIIRPDEVGDVYKAFDDEQARTMFLTLMLTTLRRMEILGLRWKDVKLTDPDGAYLHVGKSKSKAGVRDISIPPTLADRLFEHRASSKYQGEDEYVFPHPEAGWKLNPRWYAERFRAALKKAGITDYVRPFHDLRHSAITNLALDAQNAATLRETAGHSKLSTTEHYIRLAGQRFPEEVAALESRYGFTLAQDRQARQELDE